MADLDNLSVEIESKVKEITNQITQGMKSRAYRASNELRNASQEVLRGQRSGRVYRVPGTKAHYTASAPGEPPAVRTGAFRIGWHPKTETTDNGNDVSIKAYVESGTRTDNGKYLLGEIMEHGTPGGKIAPRPHHEKIQQKALPKIVKIYKEPYL